MSACEKCWADAWRRGTSIVDSYDRLMDERSSHPCTPEQQAGPDATTCDLCGRRACHQHTGECMACHGVQP